MRHSFDWQGVCYLCGKRWAETVGTQCKGWEGDDKPTSEAHRVRAVGGKMRGHDPHPR
jgi:hypothetical protein